MSGIAGFTHVGSGSMSAADCRARLEAMCNAIRHRGPSGDGYYIDTRAALGVRRLETSMAAGVPACADGQDDSITVVFDGTISNASELESELAALGHPPRGGSARTIIHGYKTWGEGVFDRLQGVFAIALWDGRNDTLLAARDRAGVKPLYYSSTSNQLFFASEPKSLLTIPEIDRQIDPSALEHYLAYLLMPRDRSVFRGIRKLRPGHYLKVHRGALTIRRYWQLRFSETFDGSEIDAAECVHRSLTHSLRRQTEHRSSFGVLLSGGINSSVVAASLAQAAGRQVATFCVGFGQRDAEVLQRAKQVAQQIGSDHHEVIVEPNAATVLERLVWHLDEPFGDPSAIAYWYLSEAVASAGLVFSGDGADEVFGGCQRYLPPPKVAAFDRVAGRPGRHLAAAAWRLLPANAPGRNFLRHVSLDPRGRYVDAMTFGRRNERRNLLSPDVLNDMKGETAEAEFKEPFRSLSQLPWAAQMMAFDFETDLADDVLTKIDRMAAAHSVDWRLPLLDDEVVEFGAHLPLAMKVRKGELKPVLKHLALNHVGRDLVEQPKQGFGMAIDRWFREPLRDVFGDMLQSSTTRQRGYFNNAAVDRTLDEYLAGKQDHAMRLWQLLVFELWIRQHTAVPAMAA
jgi:asparagine synthase (glutamine-hydrolysing)